MATSTATRRVVVVSRPTEYELLLATHSTHEQARFFLRTRGQDVDAVLDRHMGQQAALEAVGGAIPAAWRRSRVDRADLDRFLFEADDIVCAVGQDGLVANVAKYLDAQPVVGINPDPARNTGILVPHPPQVAADLIADVAAGRAMLEERTMVTAELDDGQHLLALNEIFVGHRTHQSARYRLAVNDREERQSSSGIIVSTGTGATGWALSISRQVGWEGPLPRPTDPYLAYFVREPFPSVATSTDIGTGVLAPADKLVVRSEMDGGVIFGDGIEADHLVFDWGRTVAVSTADRHLRLVV